MPADDGKQFKINRKDMKVIVKPCADGHRMVKDPTEVNDVWQGYVCKDCNIGKLVRHK